MTEISIKKALEKYSKEIPQENMIIFQDHLKEASDDCMPELMDVPLKSKTATLLFSIFLGGIAVDRFFIGDIGVGVAKLIFRLVATFLSGIPVLGWILSLSSLIWCIADIFITYRITKEINYDRLVAVLKKNRKTEQDSQPVI